MQTGGVFEAVQLFRTVDIVQRRLYALLFVLFLGVIVPFFVLIHYAQPSADDFCYAALFRHAGFWDAAKGEYLGHKGRYSTIILTAAYHQLGGMLLTYQYALLLFLISLFVAMYVFVWSLVEGRAPWGNTLFLTLGLGALYLGTMPEVSATLYWLDGAFQYQLGGVFVLLSLAALATLYRTGKPLPAVAACAFIFVAIGATEVAMTTLVAVVAVMAINRVWIHRRDRPLWAAVIVVTIVSTALLVLAPGNYVRAEGAPPEARHFWFALNHAWYYGGVTLGNWLASPLLWLATAAFVPPVLRLVHLERIRREASWLRFGVIVCLLVGLVWAYNFFLWWVAAARTPARMLNMIYLLFLAGWFIAILELVAVTARRFPLAFVEQVFPIHLRISSSVVTVLLGAFLVFDSHAATAYVDLAYRVGEYDQIMNNRYAVIAAAKEKAGSEPPAVVLRGIADPPRVLVHSDIRRNAGDWRNGCFARYFGLKSAVRR